MTQDFDITLSSAAYKALIEQQLRVFEKEFFFVLGMPKSGTTWLELILDAHPEILCKGETNLEQAWKRPLAKTVETFNELATKRGLNDFGAAESELLYLTGIMIIVNKWLVNADPGIRLIGERSPNFMVRRIRSWRALLPGAKYIHIIRDPRDGAVSGWFFFSRKWPQFTMKKYGNIETFAHFYISGWLKQMDKLSLYQTEHPVPILEIRYERLVNDPGSEIQRLYTHLGVDDSANLVDSIVDKTSFSVLSGREPGIDDRTGSKFRKGIVGDWRNHLGNKIFDAYIDEFDQYGYGHPA